MKLTAKQYLEYKHPDALLWWGLVTANAQLTCLQLLQNNISDFEVEIKEEKEIIFYIGELKAKIYHREDMTGPELYKSVHCIIEYKAKTKLVQDKGILAYFEIGFFAGAILRMLGIIE